MKSKEEIPNKTDYMKAYSFNLIQTERTNCELEHHRNVGKIDGAFYRNFSWQIMGKKKAKPSEIVKTEKREVFSEINRSLNGAQGRSQPFEDVAEPKEGKLVQIRTDLKGRSPQRYTTTCYFKPRVVPAWYTESLLIHIGSTKRLYDEKVWFKHKLQPYYWSENMTTEVNSPPTKSHTSTAAISLPKTHEHYLSLEPQQLAAGAS